MITNNVEPTLPTRSIYVAHFYCTRSASVICPRRTRTAPATQPPRPLPAHCWLVIINIFVNSEIYNCWMVLIVWRFLNSQYWYLIRWWCSIICYSPKRGEKIVIIITTLFFLMNCIDLVSEIKYYYYYWERVNNTQGDKSLGRGGWRRERYSINIKTRP